MKSAAKTVLAVCSHQLRGFKELLYSGTRKVPGDGKTCKEKPIPMVVLADRYSLPHPVWSRPLVGNPSLPWIICRADVGPHRRQRHPLRLNGGAGATAPNPEDFGCPVLSRFLRKGGVFRMSPHNQLWLGCLSLSHQRRRVDADAAPPVSPARPPALTRASASGSSPRQSLRRISCLTSRNPGIWKIRTPARKKTNPLECVASAKMQRVAPDEWKPTRHAMSYRGPAECLSAAAAQKHLARREQEICALPALRDITAVKIDARWMRE